MNVLGVIAEYNPFHNGHQYHLAQARLAADFDGVIAVMSGHFTQRGEVAIFDKWTRTAMALQNGVDLVLELPAAFATRSANYFAAGGILSLQATGLVTHFTCGIESNQPQLLQTLAAYLAREPEEYQAQLQVYLQQGLSFPAAQQKALLALRLSGAEELSQPNNILALNYLQILHQQRLPLVPVFIQRQGSYHSTAPATLGQFASATAIRQRLLTRDDSWQSMVPQNCVSVLQSQLDRGYHPLQNQDLAQAIFALLRRSTPEQLASIIDVNEGLEHRILALVNQTSSLEQLLAAIKSKRYTYTRIQRLCIHLLLNYTKDLQFTQPAYLRILGFNQRGQQLLKEMKKQATLPLITRVAADGRRLNTQAQQMLALDIRATDLYYLGYHDPALGQGGLDYQTGPVQAPKIKLS